MAVVTVSSKGQITLPKEVRDRLEISRGSKLQVLIFREQVVLIPLPEDPIKALKGSVRFKRPISEVVREVRAEEELHEATLERLSR